MKKLIPPLPAATLPPMKHFFHAGLAALALLAMAAASARAETRMQVAVGSTPIYAQASASGQTVGNATSGETIKAQPLPGFIQDIAAAGGLINYVKGSAK